MFFFGIFCGFFPLVFVTMTGWLDWITRMSFLNCLEDGWIAIVRHLMLDIRGRWGKTMTKSSFERGRQLESLEGITNEHDLRHSTHCINYNTLLTHTCDGGLPKLVGLIE